MDDAEAEHELVVAPAVDAVVRRRRRVHRAVLGALIAAPVVAVLAIPTFRALGGENDTADEVSAAAEDDEPTTATTRHTSTTTSTTETVAAETTIAAPATTLAPTTTGPTTTAPRRTPTTAAPAPTPTTLPAHCRDSNDPACGPFYWDPAPAPNQPLRAWFVDLPARWNRWDGPLELNFDHVDPDAVLMFMSVYVNGAPYEGNQPLLPDCSSIAQYGPWTPQAPASSSGLRHPNPLYLDPGVYDIALGLSTGGCRNYAAYASTTILRATVEIYDEPPPPEDPPPAE